MLTADPPEAEFELVSRGTHPISIHGTTPASISGLPVGPYQIDFARGRFKKEVTTELAAVPTNNVSVTFDYAKVAFTSVPGDAEIRQSDESLGRTPKTIPLIPGAYKIRIEREGFYGRDIEFEVKGNEEREIATTLVNIAFAEALKRAESLVNQFNPDYVTALNEIEKALVIDGLDPQVLHLREEILLRQMIAQVRDLGRQNRLDEALKLVKRALEKHPTDKAALDLKSQLERVKDEMDARLAEERRQRPSKIFNEFVNGIKHNDLFDMQKLTVKISPGKALTAVHRAFSTGKPSWTLKNDRVMAEGVFIVEADTKNLLSKQHVVILVGETTDESCEILFKLWQYSHSNNVQIINGKMTEDSWAPIHPRYSSWAAEVVKGQRSRDIEAIRQKLESELKSP